MPIEVRPKIHIFRIICIVLPCIVQSLSLGVMYGLFTSMFMMLLGEKPWFTPMTWIISPIFGLFGPFFGAWNDSLVWKYRRRGLTVVGSLILCVSFISFEFCHMQLFSSIGANVASGFVGFVLYFVSQIIMPTTTRSLLFDVLGTGQEMLGNTVITIVGTFGGLTGSGFIWLSGHFSDLKHPFYPFFYSLIFIVLLTIPPLFAGKEEWYLKKRSESEPDLREIINEDSAQKSAAAIAVEKEQSDFAKLSAFKKIFACLFRYLKGGPLTRVAVCMFLSGVSGYGMLTIGVDFTSIIIYHGDRAVAMYDKTNAYWDGVKMSAIIMMVSSIAGVLFSFFSFPVLKLLGYRVSMVAVSIFGLLMNAVYFIPPFSVWNRKLVWIQFASIPFTAVLGAAAGSVPYIVVNESITTDNGLFIAVLTLFYIIGCFIPSISNFILSSFLPEFLAGRHRYQWYCVSYFVYGVFATIAACFVKHGVLYDIMQASLKQKKEAQDGQEAEKGLLEGKGRAETRDGKKEEGKEEDGIKGFSGNTETETEREGSRIGGESNDALINPNTENTSLRNTSYPQYSTPPNESTPVVQGGGERIIV